MIQKSNLPSSGRDTTINDRIRPSLNLAQIIPEITQQDEMKVSPYSFATHHSIQWPHPACVSLSLQPPLLAIHLFSTNPSIFKFTLRNSCLSFRVIISSHRHHQTQYSNQHHQQQQHQRSINVNLLVLAPLLLPPHSGSWLTPLSVIWLFFLFSRCLQCVQNVSIF